MLKATTSSGLVRAAVGPRGTHHLRTLTGGGRVLLDAGDKLGSSLSEYAGDTWTGTDGLGLNKPPKPYLVPKTGMDLLQEPLFNKGIRFPPRERDRCACERRTHHAPSPCRRAPTAAGENGAGAGSGSAGCSRRLS